MADPEFTAMLHRVAEAAGKRGERLVGYSGDADGQHFRFQFAPAGRRRERIAQPEPPRERSARPAKVSRGVQGSLI